MRLIDADRFRSTMWHTFGEQDDYFNKGMAKWDSGLWVRYKAVEEVLDSQPTIEAVPVYAVQDEDFRIASEVRIAVGCKTAKECWELARNGDIQVVKHGEWTGINKNRYNDDEATCSICGATIASDYSNPSWWDYCPNCGARMDGGESDK